MTESRDYLEMTFRSIECFADDGKLDADELMTIANIALRDGVVDDNEKRVLKNIIARLNPEELDDELQEKIRGLTTLFDL
ncbi:MAG: hypothetical protein R3309_04530 [Reinekea sp.]|nr:hypothetical protein [Reinekea sp.]MDX1473412.1 hypothetical protein [Reinekea sp.]